MARLGSYAMEYTGCLQFGRWTRAAGPHHGRGLDDEKETGCQAVRRVMKNLERNLEGEGLALLVLVAAAAGTWCREG